MGVAYPCFPRKMEMEGEGCPRELRARGRYNIQGWGGDPSGGRAAHCIKVYHLRFFLIIIAFVDNGPGIICYREMSWSRNFLNYFGSQLFFFRPRFTLPSPPFPLPFLPPFFLLVRIQCRRTPSLCLPFRDKEFENSYMRNKKAKQL